ncbi:probable cytochrome P450 6d5 [Galendromus occidentalis]|uniref:Probable cytochrome P450 6d5 n=1 Tax=Galendromus occidentalis TaxID=34638 RepID=A0AAJ6QTM2_9ACAR|nr:probable cytochrome P450 6d5 [Galendromus occidentalis]
MYQYLLFVILVLVLTILYKIHRATTFWRNAGIPYEPYLQYLHSYFVRYKQEDVYTILEEYNRKYGLVYGTYQGLTPALRVSTLEGCKDLLTSNFMNAHKRSIEVKTGAKLWDNSLFSLDYKTWKTVRKLTTPGFTPAKLRFMVPKMQRNSERMSQKLSKIAASENNIINPVKYAQGFAIDEIAALAYGLELDAMEDPKNPFVVSGQGVFAPCLGLTLLLSVPWLLKYVPVHYPQKHVMKFLTEFSTSVIKSRRQRQFPSNEIDILGLWLEEQKTNPEFTDDLVAAQTFTFFTAGFETTAMTLSFTLYMLALHPEAQDRAYRNILENVSDIDNITYDDYSRMKFVEACFTETLRLYPTDYIVDRITQAPCTIADVKVEAGMAVQIPIPAMHRDSRYFPEPLKYRPERFLNEDCQAFMTFGDGPKGCIGRRLALLQLTVLLTAVLTKVRLEPRPDDKNADIKELPIKLNPGMPYLATSKDSIDICVLPRGK